MNGYEIVKQLIDEGKYHISDNALHDISENQYPIVVAILQTEYHARFQEPFDYHYCGEWYFENPKRKKKDYYDLYYLMDYSIEIKSLWRCEISEDNGLMLASEIIRLDSVNDNIDYWVDNKSKEYQQECVRIWNILSTEGVYKGKNRVWILRNKKDY